RLKRSFSPMGAVVTDTVEHINKLYEQKEKITGIPTGFSDLNEKTAGLQPSDLIVVAGRPSTGKTSLALGMALHAALHSSRPSKVAIFSLEMSKEQLCMRLLSAEGRVDMHRIRTGQLQREDWPNLTRAASKLSESKIYIDDTPGITALEMRAKIRRQKAETGLDLVVVDYLQLMSGSDNSENRQQEISIISRSLKSVAKELNIPVIALSQLSRAVESRPDRRPVLADLRESGAIEQDADLVLMIYRRDLHAAEKGKTEDWKEERTEEKAWVIALLTCFALLSVDALATERPALPAKPPGSEQAPDPAAFYHFMLGYQRELYNDAGEAEAEYLKALARDPNSVAIHLRLATLYQAQGEHDKAQAHAEAALARDATNLQALHMLASVAVAAGRA